MIFSTNEVSRVAHVTLRQLQWWDERNVVPVRHMRHNRIYETGDLFEIAVIAELRRRDVSLQKLRPILRKIKDCVRRYVKAGGEIEFPNGHLMLVLDAEILPFHKPVLSNDAAEVCSLLMTKG